MSSSTIDRRYLVISLLIGLMALASTAHAEPKSFKSSYGEGKSALQKGAFEDALTHFRKSLLDAGDHQAASWKGMIGVAFAFRGLEQPGYALEYYRRFLDSSATHEKMLPPKWRARRQAVQAEVTELENQALETHALVSVTSTPTQANLALNGLPVGADGDAMTPYPLYLKPGDYTLTISVDGHDPVNKTLSVSAGELVPMSVSLSPKVAPQPAPTVAPTPAAAPTPEPSQPAESAPAPVSLEADTTEGAGSGPYIMFGTAGAAALAGIGLSVAGTMKKQELEERERHYANLDTSAQKALTGLEARAAVDELNEMAKAHNDMQLGASVAYGISAVTLLTGVIWLLVAEPDEAPDAAQVMPALGFSPQRGGMMTSATWRF